MMDTPSIIYCCNHVLDIIRCTYQDRVALWIVDGKIDKITAKSQIPADLLDRVIDFGEAYLIPGLIDAHVHLFGNETPGAFRDSGNETESRLLLRACENARKALRAGITTVRDCGGRGTIIQELRDAVKMGLAVGPRILSSGMPITTTGGHCYYLGLEADGVVEVQKAVRSLHKQNVDFIKVMVTGGGITAGSNSRRSQYSLEELRAIVDDAHRLGKRVAGHVHGREGIEWAVEAGFDTLEHCSWLAAEGQGRDYQKSVVSKIKDKGIYVCRSIAGFERTRLEEANPDHRFWNDYQVFRNMVEEGVRLVAGSDSGIDYTPIDGFPLTLETMAGFGNMPVSQVLQSATITAAEGIGISDQVGSITAGKVADFIVVDRNPLMDLTALRKIRYVIQAGKIAAQDGKLIDR